VHISHEKAKKLIYKVLSSMPIDVFDDDDGSVWESSHFELYTPRPEGDFEGSREIGAANIVSAFNLLHQKMLIAELSKDDGFSDCADECFELFTNVMDDLQETNLIRKRPEVIRETFKVIEGTDVANER
tara:strand:+ start:4497 stop:4883 length:387 start_codon:yes stop_codon:yes gene_type:complete